MWRAGVGAGPFVQIAEVANTEYEDSATGGALHVYDVTPIW